MIIVRTIEQHEAALMSDVQSVHIIGPFSDKFRKTYKMRKAAKNVITNGVATIATLAVGLTIGASSIGELMIIGGTALAILTGY